MQDERKAEWNRDEIVRLCRLRLDQDNGIMPFRSVQCKSEMQVGGLLKKDRLVD